MRQWFVSPFRLIPGTVVDHYGRCSDKGTGGSYSEPYPTDPCDLRGPFDSGKKAFSDAKSWRHDSGKRSNIWVALVVDNVVEHCTKYNEELPLGY